MAAMPFDRQQNNTASGSAWKEKGADLFCVVLIKYIKIAKVICSVENRMYNIYKIEK